MESAMNAGGNMKKTKTLNLLIVLLTIFALTSWYELSILIVKE